MRTSVFSLKKASIMVKKLLLACTLKELCSIFCEILEIFARILSILFCTTRVRVSWILFVWNSITFKLNLFELENIHEKANNYCKTLQKIKQIFGGKSKIDLKKDSTETNKYFQGEEQFPLYFLVSGFLAACEWFLFKYQMEQNFE